jgi:hypothetical protein
MQRPEHNTNAQRLAWMSHCVARQVLQRWSLIFRAVASVFRETLIRLSKPLPG